MDGLDDVDLDALIEEALDVDADASKKRSLADAQSRQDVVTSLEGAPGSSNKRPRTEQNFMPLSATEEQLCLAEAVAAMPPSQSQPPAAVPSATFRTIGETEVQEFLGALPASQVSQPLVTVAGSGGGVRTATTVQQRPPTAAAAIRPPMDMMDDDIDIDAALDDYFAEQEAEGGGLPSPEEHSPTVAGGRSGGEATPAAPVIAQRQQQAAAAPTAAAAAEQQQQQQQEQQPRAQLLGEEAIIPVRPYAPPAKLSTDVEGGCITVTSERGERVYCRLDPPHQPASTVARGGPGSGASAGYGGRLDLAALLRRARGRLLGADIGSLLAAVEQDRLERAQALSAAEAAAAAMARRHGAPRRSPGRSPAGQRRQQQQAAPASKLWVDKYAPKRFMELLSDEHTNREVVRWLKSWDACVFGAPALGGAAARGRRGAAALAQQQQGCDRGSEGGLDALGRPEHKVILLAGPPGLGKTTLAHVVAAHCGYRPVEINASDDRSGATLQSRILDAVEMQSVMGQRRPNCVIIDEIDGATGGTEGRSGIAALLRIANAAPAKASSVPARDAFGRRSAAATASRHQNEADAAGGEPDGSDGEEEDASGEGAGGGTNAGRRGSATPGKAAAAGGGGKARRQQLRPLMRPIICICNDLYAPALRPLREVARVFQIRKPSTERLAQRLQLVCAEEGLAAEKSTLRLLAERAEGDIRSCLNTLQFLAKRQSVVRPADVASAGLGQKDMAKGAFAVWGDLLKAPTIIGRAAETDAQRTLRLFGTLQDFGEHDLVLSGLHENLLQLRYFDAGLARTAAVLSHLADADALLSRALRGGGATGGLLRYLPALLVQASALVASHERPALQWPRTGGEARRAAAASRALLQAWRLRMAPALAAAAGPRPLAEELLPALLHIAAPALRPVSQHLYTREEQAALRSLVSTLLSLGLRFAPEGAPEEPRFGFAEAHAAARLLAGPGEPAAAAAAAAALAARGEPPLAFRPPVHRLGAFPGMGLKGCALPAAARQAASHEADMEAIRQADRARAAAAAAPPAPWGGAGNGRASPGPPEAGAASQQQQAAAAPRATQAAGPVPLTLAQRMAAAAAGKRATKGGGGGDAAAARKGTWLDALKEQRLRAKAAGPGGGAGGGAVGRGKQFAVLYKFNEGYTNAVKRPLLMKDLL